MTITLDNYSDFKDIKNMTPKEMDVLAKDIRKFLIEQISKTGGHLASNLGVVEVTLSLYKVFNMEHDKIIWDVGHQAYVHKILTGRKNEFQSLRNYGGLSGFPKRCESKFDFFDTGHSSTSISAALGMARARDLRGEKHQVISVIGDGALTGGMSLEALNDVAYNKTNMIIILNDNQMSISENVGGISTYLSKLRTAPVYNKIKKDVNATLRRIPAVGKEMVSSIQKLKDSLKQLVVPGMFFEDLGIKYFGPIDGHNIKDLTEVLDKARRIKGPVLIHVITKKGYGYEFAEKNPNKFHGVGPFNPKNGEILNQGGGMSYSKAFGDSMISMAEEDKDIVAITAAMPDGTGLNKFSKMFPKRFFDVGIAEQHAVTLAAGMAAQGLKPVFAVYSTFLQRAYDQILHDVCIQNLPVVFAIDRAGIVGKDGETHQGIFDISYLSSIPNITIVAPKCVDELKYILKWAIKHNGPVAIRYPRGGDDPKVQFSPLKDIVMGTFERICGDGDIKIIATGKMVQHAIIAKEMLELRDVKAEVVNATFIKPLDENLLKQFAKKASIIVTLEDNVITGGMGSSILTMLNQYDYKGRFLNLGYNNTFIPHGSVEQLYDTYGLSPEKIVNRIIELYNKE